MTRSLPTWLGQAMFSAQSGFGRHAGSNGHTEGSVDLARLAGLKPAAVLCEITNPDGTMAKGDDISQFARKHDMVVLSIAELVEHRLRCEACAASRGEHRKD